MYKNPAQRDSVTVVHTCMYRNFDLDLGLRNVGQKWSEVDVTNENNVRPTLPELVKQRIYIQSKTRQALCV
jgi:hypothetical protein